MAKRTTTSRQGQRSRPPSRSPAPAADRPRTFEEVVAAQSPADRARWAASDTFNDGQSDVLVIEACDGDWQVEWIGSDSECYVTVFAGEAAEARARAYFAALKSGALKVIRSGPVQH
jgi:hypothetical protein